MESCDVAVLWSKIDRLAKIEISRSESRGNSQRPVHTGNRSVTRGPPFLLYPFPLRLSSTCSRSTQKKEAHTHARTHALALRVTHSTAFAANNYVGDFSVAVRSSLSLTHTRPRLFLSSRFLSRFLPGPLPSRSLERRRRSGELVPQAWRRLVLRSSPRLESSFNEGICPRDWSRNRNRPRMSTPPKRRGSIRAIRSAGLWKNLANVCSSLLSANGIWRSKRWYLCNVTKPFEESINR